MQLWRFHTGPQAGEMAVILSVREMKTAGNGRHTMYELLLDGKVVELSEAALNEMATPILSGSSAV